MYTNSCYVLCTMYSIYESIRCDPDCSTHILTKWVKSNNSSGKCNTVLLKGSWWVAQYTVHILHQQNTQHKVLRKDLTVLNNIYCIYTRIYCIIVYVYMHTGIWHSIIVMDTCNTDSNMLCTTCRRKNVIETSNTEETCYRCSQFMYLFVICYIQKDIHIYCI